MSSSGCSIRRAAEHDSRFVWEVNGSPSAREFSTSTASIGWEEHQAWFSAQLASPSSLLWIVEDEGRAAGVVRFRVEDRSATIGVAIAPAAQGRGLGVGAIRLATEALQRSRPALVAVALIRPENRRSLRAFERAGYVAAGSVEQQGVTLLRYECPPGSPDPSR